MNFTDLISRADDESLQTLLGPKIMGLLMALDTNNPTQLKRVLLNLRHPTSLLSDPDTRNLLIDLLRPNEATFLAQLLGVRTDPDVYSNLKKCSLRKNSDKENRLFEFFDVEALKIEEIPVPESHQVITPTYALFDHQRSAARSILRKLNAQPHRVMLHMPTGSGKTRTAMNIITDHLRGKEPGLVIWLAQTEELCEQSASEFESAWKILGNRFVNVHRFWGPHSIDISNVRDGIVIAGLAKIYSSIRTDLQVIIKLGNAASLVIIDEAHSSIAKTYELILETLVVHNRDVGLLGLTATPGRSWNDVNADLELAKFFGQEKVSLDIPGYDSPVDYLIDQGYLAKPRFQSLTHSGGLNLSKKDLQDLGAAFDIPDAVLRRLAEDEKRNLIVVSSIEQLASRHKRLIVFAATREHSDLIAAVLQARGMDARSITSQTGSGERARAIDAFKQAGDDTKILCNYGVLTTGFDAPRTSGAVIARPTKSLVLYSQMVGRAIRGPKAGGNPEAEIITILDRELPGFQSVSDAFSNWEDVWRK
jgi:DNA repair protein RadD